ncbi:MAG: septum formation protein Maf [Calditrichaeota bacterium]|nr:MAG: septum formation protein Maf [Calditrichota bacterium]
MVVNSIFESKKFILASGSPRRKQLFTMMGLHFTVDAPHIEEHITPGLPPRKIALSLAQQKGEVISRKHNEGLIVAADTIVVVDGKILGKPIDKADAYKLLAQLSGRQHEVITGVYIDDAMKGRSIVFAETTKVEFKKLTEEEIYGYIDTGHPMDKAGAYGIQDISAVFVKRIEGCFYNVVGFPVAAFYQHCLQLFDERLGANEHR